MRKLFFTALLLSATSAAFADDAQVVIKQKSGNTTILTLSTNPVITFEDENMVITTSFTCVSIPLSNVDSYTAVDETTGITNVTTNPQFKAGEIAFSDLPAKTRIAIYSLGGRLVGSQMADDAGNATVSLENLSKGIYIIKTPNANIKVTNK